MEIFPSINLRATIISFVIILFNIIIPANAIELSSCVTNVKEFGDKGDGLNDDASSIQKAINSAIKNGGGIVFFSPGIYKILSTIKYSNKILLYGSGQDVTVIDVQFEGTGLEPMDKFDKLTIFPETAYMTIKTSNKKGIVGVDTSNVIRGHFHHLVVKDFKSVNIKVWGEGGSKFNGYNVFERITLSGSPIQIHIFGVSNENVVKESQFDAYKWGYEQGNRKGIGIMFGREEDIGKRRFMSNNNRITNSSFENLEIGILINHGIRHSISFNRFEAVDTAVVFRKNIKGSSDLHVLLFNYYSVDGTVPVRLLDEGTYRLQKIE